MGDDYKYSDIFTAIADKNRDRSQQINSYIFIYFPDIDRILVQLIDEHTFKLFQFPPDIMYIDNNKIIANVRDATELDIVITNKSNVWNSDAKLGKFYLSLIACKILDDACVIILRTDNRCNFNLEEYINSKNIKNLTLIDPHTLEGYILDANQTKKGVLDVIEEIFVPEQYKLKIEALDHVIQTFHEFNNEIIQYLYNKMTGLLSGKNYTKHYQIKIHDFCGALALLHTTWVDVYKYCLNKKETSVNKTRGDINNNDVQPIYDIYLKFRTKYRFQIADFLDTVEKLPEQDEKLKFIIDLLGEMGNIMFDTIDISVILATVKTMIYSKDILLENCGIIYGFSGIYTNARLKLIKIETENEDNYADQIEEKVDDDLNNMFNDSGNYTKQLDKLYKLFVNCL